MEISKGTILGVTHKFKNDGDAPFWGGGGGEGLISTFALQSAKKMKK